MSKRATPHITHSTSPISIEACDKSYTHINANDAPQDMIYSWQAYMEAKGAEYGMFDTSRMPRIFASLAPFLPLPPHIIHILGTNGKGSTGRFIALGLLRHDKRVLHFSSPHLQRFNERFYKNGRVVSDAELEQAHNILQAHSISTEASYFEYATLLACVLARDCEYFVCEAGLGGEFDSTNILQESVELSIFTPISYDHMELLGEDLASIASTKLRAMSKRALLAPQPYRQVESIARDIALHKQSTLITLTKHDIQTYLAHSDVLAYVREFAPFLQENFCVALRALAELGVLGDGLESVEGDVLGEGVKSMQKVDSMEEVEFLSGLDIKEGLDVKEGVARGIIGIKEEVASSGIKKLDFARTLCAHHLLNTTSQHAQDMQNISLLMQGFPAWDLPARWQRLAPNIILDVGHNAACARAVASILTNKRVKLVYNAFFQKDVREILRILQPHIDCLLICPVVHARVMPKADLIDICVSLGIAWGDFVLHKSSLQAHEEYVVFGSFSVIEAFMEMWNA